jgi:hypothetical protein
VIRTRGIIEPIGQGFRFGRGDGLQRRDVQPLVTHFDTFKLAPLQALREALQPPVEFAAARKFSDFAGMSCYSTAFRGRGISCLSAPTQIAALAESCPLPR